jgi:hypothetical protein
VRHQRLVLAAGVEQRIGQDGEASGVKRAFG